MNKYKIEKSSQPKDQEEALAAALDQAPEAILNIVVTYTAEEKKITKEKEARETRK